MFENFIALTELEEATPPVSGLYLDTLEGISIKNVGDFNIEKHETAIDLVESKSRFSADLVVGQVWNELRQKIAEKSWLPLKNSFTSRAATGNCVIELLKNDTAEFAKIYVNSISFKVKDDEEVTVLIKNKEGETLKTYTETAINDEVVTIHVDTVFDEKVIYIETDLTGRNTYVTDLRYISNCCGYDVKKQRIKIAQKTDGTKNLYNAKGLTVDYCLQCNIDSYKESAALILKNAILYKCGSEVLKELVSSTRLNMITLHSKDWAEAKILEWEQTAIDLAFAEIDNIFSKLQLKDRYCIQPSRTYSIW